MSKARTIADRADDAVISGDIGTTVQAYDSRLPSDVLNYGIFHKVDHFSVVFTKTGANTASIKAGTRVEVNSVLVTFTNATAITMPTLTGGTDYAIYVCSDGSIRADSNWSAPSGYTTTNSRKIGGFHYGLVASGTTVAGGSFATTGNGMIWTQTDVNRIAGINEWSLWDIKYMPSCGDARGMSKIGNAWCDIYLCSTDVDTNGTSKYNSNIASGTVLPKIPTMFGGNGTTTYPTLNWWVANELLSSRGKRMPLEIEFVVAAYGVTENQSIGGASETYPNTQRNAGYTSKFGIEQASGHHWVWGLDSNFYSEVASPAGSWKTVTGNNSTAGLERGQLYTYGVYGLTRVLHGGSRTFGASSGSRASSWSNYPWASIWSVGCRGFCDHLQLV